MVIDMANISIIIPCYNVAPYIDRCLTSITRQTLDLQQIEIICIDDASTDDTWMHLQKWEEAYPENIILIHCNVNGRQGSARNIGLQYASGEWIAFIDADDWVEPDYLEKMYSIALQGNCDVVTCLLERDSNTSLTFFDNKRSDKESRFMVIDSMQKRKLFFNLQSAGYGPCNKLIRTDILRDNQLFFPEKLAYEDCYFSPLLHFYIDRIYLLEEKLYHYFVNPHSTVLTMDADYHTDYLTVQSMKWEEWVRRGLLTDYREELEYDFLYSCYLGFLKIILFRYTEPSYSLYLLLREMVIQKVPDYRQNKYINDGFSPFYLTLLEALVLPLSKEQFMQFATSAKAYWQTL